MWGSRMTPQNPRLEAGDYLVAIRRLDRTADLVAVSATRIEYMRLVDQVSPVTRTSWGRLKALSRQAVTSRPCRTARSYVDVISTIRESGRGRSIRPIPTEQPLQQTS
jgi:hypothetical protein